MNLRGFLFSWIIISLVISGCTSEDKEESKTSYPMQFLSVLGTAQDAGFPQVGCDKECCADLLKNGEEGARVTSLSIIDQSDSSAYLFEATPDFKHQWSRVTSLNPGGTCSGIFLTHAHIGHYTGLMDLGRESMGASSQKVFVMPRMRTFLESNGPWKQLVDLNNIDLVSLYADSSVQLNERICVIPLLVPHRDEFSETVGYLIEVNDKKVLFIPDIDKWEKWETVDIKDMIRSVDFAFLDATFYMNGELPGRDMSEIPHPFVEESMTLFSELKSEDKAKVYFIHFNHTNPLLWDMGTRQKVEEAGFHIAKENQILNLSK